MYICSKCGKKIRKEGNFCPDCGGALVERPKIPASRGAKARLIILWIIVVIAAVSAVCSLFNDRLGLYRKVVEGIGGFGLICVIGAFFWGFIKWIVVVAPKSFRAANTVSFGLLYVPFLGILLRVAIYLIILVVPCAVYGYSFILLWKLAYFGAENPTNLLYCFGMFTLGTSLVAILTYWDVCALKGLRPVRDFRRILRRG